MDQEPELTPSGLLCVFLGLLPTGALLSGIMILITPAARSVFRLPPISRRAADPGDTYHFAPSYQKYNNDAILQIRDHEKI